MAEREPRLPLHAREEIDYWRDKAFGALETLKQANDNCERLASELDEAKAALRELAECIDVFDSPSSEPALVRAESVLGVSLGR